MSWTPISETEIQNLIAENEALMELAILQRWIATKVPPQKWSLSPWGDEGGGFWVVGIKDGYCIWYNDIEDGFNVSTFQTEGFISMYRCNQDTLVYLFHKEPFGTSG